jgi:glyoxylase I family protein
MNQVPTQVVHHVTLTITDLQRSCDFYSNLLGFQMAAQLSPTRVLLTNGKSVLALTLPPDASKAIPNDRFSENRVGLDHISFSVDNYAALEEAHAIFDRQGVPHGPIEDSGMLYTLAFRDPDNIQLELSAPKGE